MRSISRLATAASPPQRTQVSVRLLFPHDIADELAVLCHCPIERRQVARQGFVDGKCPKAFHRVASEVRVVELRRLERVVTGDEGVDGALAVPPCGGQQVDSERRVGLARHVFRDASPEVAAGNRRDVSERLPVPLGFVDGRLEMIVQVVPRLRLSAL